MTASAESPLLDMARAGDPEAFARLCAEALPAIYDFAWRMTGDEALAARATRSVLVEAARRLGSLRAGDAFRPWVLGIAREEAMEALSGSGGPAGPRDAGQVGEAAARLDPRTRAIVELHLRHGLDAGSLAQALGISAASAAVVLRRALPAVEEAFATAVLADPGHRCRRLGKAIANAHPASGEALAQLVSAHRGSCRVCQGRLERLGSPLEAYAAIPAAALPAALEEQAIAEATRRWPGPVPAPQTFRDAGPPPPRGPRTALFMLFGGTAAAAGMLVLAMLLPGSPISLQGPDDPGESAFLPLSPTVETGPGTSTPTPRRTATPSRLTATPSATASATPSPAPTPGPGTPTSTATTTPTPTATASATPTPVQTPTPGPTPTPCAPKLATNVGSVNVGDGDSSVFFALNQGCGTLPFGAAVGSGVAWLSVSPATGEISGATGNEARVTVTVNRLALAEGTSYGTVKVTGAGTTIMVTVQAVRIGDPPEIISTSGFCTGGVASVTAEVQDDIGVSRVDVKYSTPGGPASSPLFSAGGGQWSSGELAVPPGAGQFVVVAVDGAGQQTTADVEMGPC